MYKKYVSNSSFRKLAKPKAPIKDDVSSMGKDIPVRYSVLSKNTNKTTYKNRG